MYTHKKGVMQKLHNVFGMYTKTIVIQKVA